MLDLHYETMRFYYSKGGGGLGTLPSGGQTPYPISTIFNRLPEGTIDNTKKENEDLDWSVRGNYAPLLRAV